MGVGEWIKGTFDDGQQSQFAGDIPRFNLLNDKVQITYAALCYPVHVTRMRFVPVELGFYARVIDADIELIRSQNPVPDGFIGFRAGGCRLPVINDVYVGIGAFGFSFGSWF